MVMHTARLGSRALRALLLAAFAGGASSCADSSGPGDSPGTKPEGNLNVVRVAPGSTPLFNASDSFYAKRGEDREVRIYFQDAAGGQGEEYLRLRVNAGSLRALPDGTPIVEGDSVLIRASVVDPARMLFQLEPSGLQFDPGEPAELKIHYDHADGDINDDGSSDGVDRTIESTLLGIWRQEKPGDPFVRLGAVLELEIDEADAELTGFSRYALAY
jgi:hypothetical protein